MKFRMRLSLPTKSALLTTSLVLALLGATAAWQYRQLSREYTGLLEQQLNGLAQVAAEDLDYKLAMHVATLSREAPRGGGLNLPAANHVLHFARWWTRAVEQQATDRVHRLGQRKP